MNTELLTSDVRKLYFKYLLPSLGGVLATSIYSTVDTIAVGQACGPDGAAAIAVINPLFAIFNFIGLLFGIGASVEMSRAKGEGNREKADRIFSVSLVLLAVAGVVSWSLISLFLEELLYFCGADDVLLPYAMDYSFWIVLSYPLFLFNVFMAPVIRYDEKPDTIMKATLAGGLFNVFGDYFFVFPLSMGMAGAGLATAMGALIQTLVLSFHFIRKQSALSLRRERKFMSRSLRIISSGFGASILDVAIGALTVIANRQTMKYGGSDELAVLGIVMTISFILQHLFAGIGQAVQPIASTNYGAGKTDRVWQSYRYLIWTAFIFGLVSTAACELFPLPLINLFVDASENVLEIGPHIVRVYSASLFFMSLNINIVFFLQSILIPVPSLIISLARGLVLSGILLIILPLFTGFDGILYALVLAEVLCTLFALPYMMNIRHKAVRCTVSARS